MDWFALLPSLAEAVPNPRDKSRFSTEVMLLLAAIVAAGFLAAFIALAIRKRVMAKDEAPPLGFTLMDIRQMHAEGQLSDEELAHAEQKMLARSRSHYLGGDESEEGEEPEDLGDLGDLEGPRPDPPESSTNDPPPTEDGPDEDGPDTDKNPGAGPAG